MLARKKNKSTQKRKVKANKKPEKVMKHVDPCDACGSPVQQPKQLYPPPMATLLPFSNSFTGMSLHVIAAVQNFTIKVTLTHQEI